MKKIIYSLAFAACAISLGFTQTIITQWDFNSITAGDLATATPSTGAGTIGLVGNATTPNSGSTGAGSSDLSATNLAFQTTTYPAQGMGNQTTGVQFNVNTTGFENIQLSFDLRLSNTSSRWIQVQYTLNGSMWQNLGTPTRIGGMADDNAGDSWHNANAFDFSAITGANNNTNFGVRLVTSFSSLAFTIVNTGTSFGANEAYEPARNPSIGTSSDYGGGTMRYDMVTFQGDELPTNTPTIIANPTTLASFNQVIGAPSPEQTFVVSASNLSATLTIQAPASYEVSLSSGAGFQSSLNLTPMAGTIAATTIFVRLNVGIEGNYSGDIVLSSAGATTENVSVTGITSLAPLPQITVSPTGLSGFLQTLGTPSDEQTITVSGTNLSSDITVTAPSGYEVSLTTGAGFGTAVVLSHVGGTVDPTLVYVRLNETSVGTFLADIILSTVDLPNVLVPVSGSVEGPAEPMLAVSPTVLNPFSQNLGFPSAAQFVTVGGDNLTGDITLTSNSNFFISIDGNAYVQSLTLSPVGGFVDPVQIYVHLSALNVGVSNGVLNIATSGATEVNIELSGTSVQTQGALLYYWHFNTLETPVDVTSIDADFSLLPGVTGKFDYTNPVEGQRDMDVYDLGSDLNVQMGEGSGKACRARNPSTDRTLDFFVPTSNATGIRFAYAVHRSGQGMLENIISYSINGIDYITTDLENNTIIVTETYELHTFDFSDINAANDNPDFRIRIAFNENTVAANGNNRFDNFTLTANTFSNIASNELQHVLVYPNPSNDLIHVSSEHEIKNITFFDLNGRMVLVAKEDIINIEALESGMYFILIETNVGTVQKSIVKK